MIILTVIVGYLLISFSVFVALSENRMNEGKAGRIAILWPFWLVGWVFKTVFVSLRELWDYLRS